MTYEILSACLCHVIWSCFLPVCCRHWSSVLPSSLSNQGSHHRMGCHLEHPSSFRQPDLDVLCNTAQTSPIYNEFSSSLIAGMRMLPNMSLSPPKYILIIWKLQIHSRLSVLYHYICVHMRVMTKLSCNLGNRTSFWSHYKRRVAASTPWGLPEKVV